MNTKKVQKAFDKVVDELFKVPSKDFKKILKEEKGDLAHILLEGGFINRQNENIPSKELLQSFPDVRVDSTKERRWEYFTPNISLLNKSLIKKSIDSLKILDTKSMKDNHPYSLDDELNAEAPWMIAA